MHITILNYGSRGDAQPFIALALGLQGAGHTVRMASPKMFADWVASYGIECIPLPGNIEELSREVVGQVNGNALKTMRTFMEFTESIAPEMYAQGLKACEDTDVIIYNFAQSLMAHQIARRRNVPDIFASLYPLLTPTTLYTHPLFPQLPLGGAYNILTHQLYRVVHWQTNVPQYRRMQKQGFDLPAHVHSPFAKGYAHQPLKILGFSPHIVPHDPKWPDDVHTTGFWLLDETKSWQPPDDLLAFLDAGEPPIYVGFGSMVSDEMATLRQVIVDGLRQSGKRGVLLSGWGQLVQGAIGDDIFVLDYAPFDWLFPRMAAVVHHGGVGTLAAALRANIPSVVIPFLGDHPFWGGAVARLGAGPKTISRHHLTPEKLAQAIHTVTTNTAMRQRAAELGAKLRAENGVETAVRAIENHVEKYRAKQAIRT